MNYSISDVEERNLLEAAEKLYDEGDYVSAFPIYERLAMAGNVKSKTIVGWMHQTGNGAEKSVEKAESWYSSASKAGDHAGMFYLGRLYLDIEQYPKAYGAFKVAAGLEYSPAIYRAALMELRGVGTVVNKNKAFENFQHARKLGHIFAWKTEALMLISGFDGFVGRLKGLLMYLYILIVGPIIGARDPSSDRVRE